jgi:PAP2 superfamily protein
MEALVANHSLTRGKTRVGLWSKTECLLALLVALYVFSAWLIAQVYDRPEAFRGLLYAPVSGLVFFTTLFSYTVLRIVWIMVWWHPYHLTRTIIEDFREHLFDPKRFIPALLLGLLFMVFFGAFSGMKNLIPVINPYTWDPTFASLDARLHGGIQPWRLLHGLLGYPLATSAINILYNVWFFLMIFIFFWQASTPHLPRVRLQYLLTFFLAWMVIGQFLATVFSSAGPCYYAAVTGTEQGDPYVGLMEYLRQADIQYPVWALNTQEMLWNAYRDKELRMGSGISAMPSMHVATAFLFALLGWKWGKPYNFLLTVYCVIIVLGSIHLAWHYAVDAYFAIPATYGLWRLSGFVVHRLEPPAENTRLH